MQIRSETTRRIHLTSAHMAFVICLACASPAYASGMDGLANAGAIIIGIGIAFVITMFTGILSKDELAYGLLKVKIGIISCIGITFLEWASIISVPFLLQTHNGHYPPNFVYILLMVLFPFFVNLFATFSLVPKDKRDDVPFSRRIFYSLGATLFAGWLGIVLTWYIASHF